ncbi:sodium-dependent transporter, partial [candidate division WOR-3 bacterium]|nr:sodium-dependent transporter [candidate division WOR-3 bacterium]
WDILIKFFIPIILLVIMIWNIKNEIINPYGEYSRGALLIGMFVVIATLIIAIILSIKRRKFRGVE